VALVRPHKTAYANHARPEPIHPRPWQPARRVTLEHTRRKDQAPAPHASDKHTPTRREVAHAKHATAYRMVPRARHALRDVKLPTTNAYVIPGTARETASTRVPYLAHSVKRELIRTKPGACSANLAMQVKDHLRELQPYHSAPIVLQARFRKPGPAVSHVLAVPIPTQTRRRHAKRVERIPTHRLRTPQAAMHVQQPPMDENV